MMRHKGIKFSQRMRRLRAMRELRESENQSGRRMLLLSHPRNAKRAKYIKAVEYLYNQELKEFDMMIASSKRVGHSEPVKERQIFPEDKLK